MDFSSDNPVNSNSLNLAARNNDASNVRRLLKKINPNCVDHRGWTCLHEAANSDSYKCLELILRNPQCRPLAETHEGHTALYLACRNRCSRKTIKLLLQKVKDIANYCSTEGVTPLHLVSEQGRVKLIQLLLDYGALINVQDFDGDTPLHEACLAKQPEAIKFLLHAGANPQIENEQQFTPFHLACASPCLKAVTNLTKFIDVNQRIGAGDTPLMISLRCSNNDDIINYLLDHGADPNLKNNEDTLALDIALYIGCHTIFERLLSMTDHDVINLDILCRACKPHYFTLEILGVLLTSDLGPEFYEYSEIRPESFNETLEELKPNYLYHAPLNPFLSVCDYVYGISPEKFKEFLYLYLMRGVSVNAQHAAEFPPLAYIHYCSHSACFAELFDIFMKHGCNVDYCSSSDQSPRITDAFLASLCFNPKTIVDMIPYSLYCDPGTVIEVAVNNGMLDRIPYNVQIKILNMIEYGISMAHYRSSFVPSLKHLSRLKVRDIIKDKDGVAKTTQQFLKMLNDLPVPPLIKNYLRFS